MSRKSVNQFHQGRPKAPTDDCIVKVKKAVAPCKNTGIQQQLARLKAGLTKLELKFDRLE